jgi:arginase
MDIGGGRTVRAEDVAIVGLRSLDRKEREALARAGVNVYTMKEVDAYGVASVVRSALKDLSHLDLVHLSFDLDVLDPEIAPGVGTPVRGGLTYREAHLVMELVNEAAVLPLSMSSRSTLSSTRRTVPPNSPSSWSGASWDARSSACHG